FLDQLEMEKTKQKVAVFQACYKNPRINCRQMKVLFNTVPSPARDALPKPPYFGRGFDPELYKTLGAHYDHQSGKTTFRVYAPNARGITLQLTAWNTIEHSVEMHKKDGGIWELETEFAKPGRSYHFMVVGKDGGFPLKKVDPFAF